MSKVRICTNCEFNNNGWCNKRKTNKDLKNLVECEFKKDSKIALIQRYLEQKRFEQEITCEENENDIKGIIKGLEIALKILN